MEDKKQKALAELQKVENALRDFNYYYGMSQGSEELYRVNKIFDELHQLTIIVAKS